MQTLLQDRKMKNITVELTKWDLQKVRPYKKPDRKGKGRTENEVYTLWCTAEKGK